MRKTLLLLCIITFPLACPAFSGINIQNAFARGGQVFLHWSDTETADHYHVYRSLSPITTENLDQAELIGDNVLPGSAKDTTATYVETINNRPDPNVGLRIHDLGPTLNPADALWVHTVQVNGSYYYAVTRVAPGGQENRTIYPGQNSLIQPISQSVGPVIPVLESTGTVSGNYTYKNYIWYRRNTECLREGHHTKFTVTTTPGYNPSGSYPMVLFLHHYGHYNTPIAWHGWVTVSPCNYNSFLPNRGNDWWYGCCDQYPNVSSGTVVNYTERYLLALVDWVKANYAINPNRIYLQGGSMGGTGAISFGLRHPQIFAAIVSVVPQVNPKLLESGFRSQLSMIWGSTSVNLPSSDGGGVWDRMNMTGYVANHLGDLPFLKCENSKNDFTLPWSQIPPFYKALNDARHGFLAAWGQGGHVQSGSGLPSEYSSWNVFAKVVLNSSYVVVSNSSANDDPGNGDVFDGDPVGQMNSGYDWTILADSPQEWRARIRYTPGRSVRADISARRLQQLRFNQGQQLNYVLQDEATGTVIASGAVNAIRNNFFVIPQLPFDGTNRILKVTLAP